MKRRWWWTRSLLLAGAGVAGAGAAGAFEYPLQFSLPGNYEYLVVAGYQIVGATIVGNCSYTQITSGSGRGSHPTYTPVPQTCTWDDYGALLGVVAGAPMVPNPIGMNGTETIYAQAGSQTYTGNDAAYVPGGFVFSYGAHEIWQTSNAYMVLQPQGTFTFTLTVLSDGDVPLNVSAVQASVALRHVKLVVNSTTCVGVIPVGGTCAVTVTYDDSRIKSPTGLAYDTLSVHLVDNAGQVNDFVQHYTDVVKVPVDGGGG